MSVTSTSLLQQTLVSAAEKDVTKCDTDFFSSNDILFYDPCATTCTTGQVSVTATTELANTETITTIYSYLTSTALSTNGNKPLTPAQAAGVMGNMEAESSFNPSAIENTSRAQKGHGLAQWTFGRWTALSNFATQQGKPWDDVTVQLNYLKQELEGAESGVLKDPEFSSSQDPSVTAVRWRAVFERADVNLAHDDRRITSALAVFKMFGGAAAASSCTAQGSVVAGDFVKTAINFALTSPAKDNVQTKFSDATKAYQDAIETYNKSNDVTDCGRFVATSLFASGIDKNYPSVNVTAQLAYVKSHPEKYIMNPKPILADLQRGDILYISGHTTIYTGEAQYPMVDASLGQRVPSVRPSVALEWMLSQGDITSARLIK